MDNSAPASAELPSGAYRETFLSILDPEEAAAFRSHGNVVENRFLDRVVYEETKTSYTEAEVRGALADLRFLAGFLRAVGKEREASELPPRDWQLAHTAAECAEDVDVLAHKLQEELTRLSSAPPQSDEESLDAGGSGPGAVG
jgi:hypothetical protein